MASLIFMCCLAEMRMKPRGLGCPCKPGVVSVRMTTGCTRTKHIRLTKSELGTMQFYQYKNRDKLIGTPKYCNTMAPCRYAYSSVRIQLSSELYAYPASAYSADQSCMRIRPPHSAPGSCMRWYGAYDIFRVVEGYAYSS